MPKTRRFLLVSWQGGGNVPPMIALAKRLVARGHLVTLVGTPDLGAPAARAGVRFASFGDADGPVSATQSSDEDRAGHFLRLLAGPELGDELMAAAAHETPDAVVVDAMAAGALSAAERLGIPTAVLVHLRYRYFAAEEGQGLYAAARELVTTGRAELGLDRIADDRPVLPQLWHRAGAVLVAGLAELEGPGPEPAGPVAHLGPVIDPDPGVLGDELSAVLDDQGASLVVVSLSTTYMHQEEVLGRVLEAVAGRGHRVIATLGALDPAAVAVPDGVTVVRWAPHDPLLARAELVVTHTGYGTTMAALNAGLPMVCLPMGRDQNGTAAQISALGAGVSVDPASDAPTIAEAIDEVLGKASYRVVARRLGAQIERLGRGERLVDAVEALAP